MGSATRPFHRSPHPTVGIELELQLVDRASGDLLSIAPAVIERLHREEHRRDRVKPELMQNTIELNTAVAPSVSAARADLAEQLAALAMVAEEWDAVLVSAGSHPFADPYHQRVTDAPRYRQLLEDMQDPVRLCQTYGLHVHIGVPDLDAAIRAQNALVRYLPCFLAVTNSSPFWAGVDTGLQSKRCKQFEALKLTGPPPVMSGGSDYIELFDLLVAVQAIEAPEPDNPWAGNKSIHFDVRPSPVYGTVELRICDAPPTLREAMAVSALAQCVVQTAVEDHASSLGTPLLDVVTRLNKDACIRHGIDALIAIDGRGTREPVRTSIERLGATMTPIAARLGCAVELADVEAVVGWGASALRQRAIYARVAGERPVPGETLRRDSLRAVVGALAEELAHDLPSAPVASRS